MTEDDRSAAARFDGAPAAGHVPRAQIVGRFVEFYEAPELGFLVRLVLNVDGGPVSELALTNVELRELVEFGDGQQRRGPGRAN